MGGLGCRLIIRGRAVAEPGSAESGRYVRGDLGALAGRQGAVDVSG
jgi:hypothetical protein